MTYDKLIHLPFGETKYSWINQTPCFKLKCLPTKQNDSWECTKGRAFCISNIERDITNEKTIHSIFMRSLEKTMKFEHQMKFSSGITLEGLEMKWLSFQREPR